MALPLLRSDLDDVLRATEKLWPRRAKIFMTGGTGFFGKWLQETFAHANRELQLGATLTVLTRDKNLAESQLPHLQRLGIERSGIEYVEGDVRAVANLTDEFTHVIHAATPTSQLWRPEADSKNVSVEGTQAVLDFLKQRPPTRLLHCSSGAVYNAMNLTDVPPMENDLIDEDVSLNVKSNTNPDTSLYSQGKRASEKLVLESSADYIIARCFAFLGPHLPMDGSFAAGQFFKAALAGEKLLIKGTGRDERSYMYPTDLAIWLWTLLFCAPPKSTYNVGSPDPVTIQQLAETISVEFGLTAPVIQGTGAVYARYYPDTSKAEREFGLRCRIGLAEAVRRTKEWAQQSPL